MNPSDLQLIEQFHRRHGPAHEQAPGGNAAWNDGSDLAALLAISLFLEPIISNGGWPAVYYNGVGWCVPFAARGYAPLKMNECKKRCERAIELVRRAEDAHPGLAHSSDDWLSSGLVQAIGDDDWDTLDDAWSTLTRDTGERMARYIREHRILTIEQAQPPARSTLRSETKNDPTLFETNDDDLTYFESHGAPPLPVAIDQGHVVCDGARIWYATYGSGTPVILLHGGLGHSGNWGYQVPALVGAGRRVVLIDSRGHGRSTRDSRPYSYELMASDVLAVMDTLGIQKAPIVGWSDGACIALILAMSAPERVTGVVFFACNMDPSGTKEFQATPLIDRCFARHTKDYAQLSATPNEFKAFVDAVSLMQRTEPNCSAAELARIRVPVAIFQSEHDEFIKLEHAEYLARSIPGAELIHLHGVSHFAPLQRPAAFNRVLHEFLERIAP